MKCSLHIVHQDMHSNIHANQRTNGPVNARLTIGLNHSEQNLTKFDLAVKWVTVKPGSSFIYTSRCWSMPNFKIIEFLVSKKRISTVGAIYVHNRAVTLQRIAPTYADV